MSERSHLQAAIDALEAQRESLGDTVVDTALAPLRQRLDELDATEQQRRQVTIVFVDVVGSTAMIRDLDPEDALALLDTAMERLAEPVARHRGRVTRFMGDGFLAAFGLRRGDESDPASAVRCGLQIQQAARTYATEVAERWGIPDFRVRVGIDTGVVVVGGVSEAEATLAGATVNLAARLESSAPPGAVLISQHTHRIVRGMFDVTALAPITAKGFDEPVAVYRVDAVKARTFRVAPGLVGGVEPAMVGRDADMAVLADAYARSASTAAGALVLAEPGLGKSRLLAEFEGWIDLQPDVVLLMRGRALVDTRTRPFGLLRELLAFRFEVRDDDASEVAEKRLRDGLEPLLGDAAADAAQVLGRLSGLVAAGSEPELQPKELRDRSLQALVRLLAAAARTDRVVMLLDDLQWADDSSLALLDDVLLAASETPLLVVATARPEFAEQRPDWGAGVRPALLDLAALTPEQARAALSSVLAGSDGAAAADAATQALVDQLVERAGGNPYYGEELLRMLIDDGVVDPTHEPWQIDHARVPALRVPSTLTGVIQGRVDALEPRQRTLLQQAAVVGRVFWQDAVAALNASGDSGIAADEVGGLLAALEHRELVAPSSESVIEDTTQWLFRHAVAWEVVYDGVLRDRRRDYHGRVAAWLRAHGHERGVDVSELLAEHLERAGDVTGAVDALTAAGARAATVHANGEAVAYFSRALALVGDAATATRFDLLLRREDVLYLMADRERGAADAEALRALAAGVDRPDAAAEATFRALRLAATTYDRDQVVELGDAALQLARAAGRRDLEAEAALHWARFLMFDDPRAAEPLAALAGERAQEAELPRVHSAALRTAGIIAYEQEDHETAERLYLEALAVADGAGDEHGHAAATSNLGNLAYLSRDYEQARMRFEEALASLERIGDRELAFTPVNNLAILAGELGDYETSTRFGRRALRLAKEVRSARNVAAACATLGLVQDAAGQRDEALATYREGLAAATEGEDVSGRAFALTGIGNAILQRDEPADAIEPLHEAAALRRDGPSGPRLAETRAALALALARAGRHEEARAALDQVLASLREAPELAGAEAPTRVYLQTLQALDELADGRAPELEGEARAFVARFAAQQPAGAADRSKPWWDAALADRLGPAA